MNENGLIKAVLAGLIAFVVTYVVLLIIVAVLKEVGVVEAASVVNRFAWLISLLVGLVAGWSKYEGNK